MPSSSPGDPASREPWDEMARVGVVARARGLRGEVIVHAETDFPEDRFRAGSLVFLERSGAPAAVRIRDAWFQDGRPVLQFDGVETRDAAEALRGAELRVPAASLHALPDGVYYEHDLVGCAVRTGDGAPVGRVIRVDGPRSAARLIVEAAGAAAGEAEGEIDVPLAADICVVIDPAARAIVIDPPAGLIDVNRPRAGAARSRRARRPAAPRAEAGG